MSFFTSSKLTNSDFRIGINENRTPLMLKKWQQKWKVSATQLWMILLVFAITGTATAYLSKVMVQWTGLDETTHWAWKLAFRLVVLIFGYQVIILLVAFLLGQFPFFWNYEKKILTRMGLLRKEKR